MVRSIAELAVLMSRWDVSQQRKNKWKQSRYEALDYYNGDTNDYTSKYFSASTLNKIVTGNINITKRVIDRVSLVYMTPPIRTYSNEDVVDFFVEKDLKLQRLERITNLLDAVLLKPCWRIKEDGYGCIEYDIISDYEPIFGEDPLKPEAIVYPIAGKDTVLDDTPQLWVYWDKEHTYTFDNNGKIYTDEMNPDMINPYGVLPFVECWRDGKPESSYLDTDASGDLIQTNTLINVAETNKNANIMFQSFGYIYVTGSMIEKDDLDVGPDKISFLGSDGTMNLVSPPNTVESITSAVTTAYKMLAQNYHIDISFVEGTTAVSGVALKLRGIELQDSRISDVIKWREVERQLFELERLMIAIDMGKDAGDLEKVDFEESMEVLSDTEQRDKWEWELSKGLIDEADILMQKDPDRFDTRETAQEYLQERGKIAVEAEAPEGSLLQELIKPV